MHRPFLCSAVIPLLLLAAHAAAAQSNEAREKERLILGEGVKSHAEIDDIYIRFSKAYDTLDPQAVADLYTESAAYLSPGSEVRTGRETILQSFTRSFNWTRERKEKRFIGFRIVQRMVEGGLGYDVGVFTLTTTLPDGSERSGKGKFVVVTKRGKDGKWQFQVDGYSDIAESQGN